MGKRARTDDAQDEGKSADGDVLLLNVGGTNFETTYGTVRSVEGSYLARLFAEDSSFRTPTRDASGRVFVDRDPEAFPFVLDFLRRGGRLISKRISGESWLKLYEDAGFYGLDGLLEQLRMFRGLAFEGMTVERALQFCPAKDLHRVGLVSADDLCRVLGSDDALSIFKELGVAAHELGAGIPLDKIIAAGYHAGSLFGIRVRLGSVEYMDSHELGSPLLMHDFGFVNVVEREDDDRPLDDRSLGVTEDAAFPEKERRTIAERRANPRFYILDEDDQTPSYWYSPRSLLTA